MSYQNIITIEPGKRGGKPCIRGMRITVHDVLSYLASGMTQDEILQDFPYLTATDILAYLYPNSQHVFPLQMDQDDDCLIWDYVV
jgi:uncharacterized protein (DUF433 family)